MRKLESFYDLKNKNSYSEKETLESYYWDLITNASQNFKSPYIRLLKYQKELNSIHPRNTFHYHFISMLVKNFRVFIFMKPQDMESFFLKLEDKEWASEFYTVKQYLNGNQSYSISAFGQKILDLLRYKEMMGRGFRGKDLARTLNIKSCLYCNAQYSFSYKYGGKRISKLQLDHFFSQSKYPYFSISLYNLIPSCSYCNQKKSSTDFNLNDYSHPYLESFSDRFKFALAKESDEKVLLDYKIDEEDVEIVLESGDDNIVSKHNEIFDLIGIYSNHKDVVMNLFKMAKAYPNIKQKDILNIADEEGNKLFENENELKRLIFNMPLAKKDINSMPLSKIKQDFAERLGIIKKE